MKKQFDWGRFKREKIAVHCKTEEEAKDFCKKMNEYGMKWNDGNTYLEYTQYRRYKENTCYVGDGYYCDYDFYIRRNYTILEWSDYMQKEFTKTDLKDGMIVEYRNGYRRLVINGYLIGKYSNCKLDNYYSDLKCSYSHLDIMKVFKFAEW